MLALKFGAFMVSMSLVRLGCTIVSPEPPVGEPVPDIVLSYDQEDPVSGALTVTASGVDIAPTEIEFTIDNEPWVVDTSPPFEHTYDTTELIDGVHVVKARATVAGVTVERFELALIQNRPNFVVVLVDDLDETTMPFWDAMPQTKALIADAGMNFTNGFAPDPVCCPARASILTGNFPHNTGVWDNSPPDGSYMAFRGAAELDTFATRLQAEGYSTAMIGKYLNGYEINLTDLPPGWNDWFGLGLNALSGYFYQANDNGTIVGHGFQPHHYTTDVLAGHALDYLDQTEVWDHQRFLLFLSITAPHATIPPAPRHAAHAWVDDPLPLRPNFNEADVSDKPTWIRDGLDLLDAAELAALDDEYQDRMGSLLAADEAVAAVVAKLQANGELDNTYLLFVSDNGYNLGSHRVPQKQAPYEESIRIPFAIAGPGVPVAVDDRYVSHLDIAPTLLDLALAPHDDLDGESLVPLFTGTPTWRTDQLLEFRGTHGPGADLHTLADVQAAIAAGDTIRVPTYRALRNADWLYVEWYGGTVHEYELYDMAADPFQLDNLLATPQGVIDHAATTAALQLRLEELSACAGPTCHAS